MIKKIFHISDIHIPNVDEKHYYSDMIKMFLKTLYKEVKKYNSDEVRIVLVGDIFHNKIRTSNEAKQQFHELLNYLNAMCKTIVIAGNHDMLENNKDKMDSISPTFEIRNVYENIIYADKALDYKSGCIIDNNIIWKLYSIFDNYKNTQLPDSYDANNQNVIGLYHGDIEGAVTDIGRMVENGLPEDDIVDCDCIMAGHIHKFQEIRKNGIPIVYSSSLFQQNSGENISGHGFVEWDVDSMRYIFHEIETNHRIFRFEINSYDDVKNDVERLINL